MSLSATNGSHRLRSALTAGWLLAAAATAGATEAGTTVDRSEVAHCIAVMQTKADDLARQVKAGDKSQEPPLRQELERAAALTGRVYLEGLRDEAEAKAYLRQARDAQVGWPEARRQRLHEQCVQKADAQLAAASAPHRLVVERIAERRLRRLLAKPRP